MEPFTIAMLVLGVILGIIVKIVQPRQTTIQRVSRQDDDLDMVDEMVLWGEVNNDDFYRM